MKIDFCEEFHELVAIPGKAGIVQHKYLFATGAGQGAESFVILTASRSRKQCQLKDDGFSRKR